MEFQAHAGGWADMKYHQISNAALNACTAYENNRVSLDAGLGYISGGAGSLTTILMGEASIATGGVALVVGLGASVITAEALSAIDIYCKSNGIFAPED